MQHKFEILITDYITWIFSLSFLYLLFFSFIYDYLFIYFILFNILELQKLFFFLPRAFPDDLIRAFLKKAAIYDDSNLIRR